jgi:cytochrome c-type biogenesis protein CcmH
VARGTSLLVTTLLALLVMVTPVAAEDVYSPRTLELARRMQCPVCAGQPVADSHSTLARQMRDTIEQMVQAGHTDQQIFDFFVERYGASVLTEPPRSGIGVGLWWMPVLVVLAGATVVGLYLIERRGHSPATADDDDTDDELEAIARDVLGADGGNRAVSP